MNFLDLLPDLRKPQGPPNAGPPSLRYTISPLDAFYRFLMYGHDQPSYEAGNQTKLALNTLDVILTGGVKPFQEAIKLLEDISVKGRAPKNDYAIIALAYFCRSKDRVVQINIERVFPKVVRTASHLFLFLETLKKFRGRGSFIQTLVQDWYNAMDPRSLAYQMTKYRNRNNWSHGLVMRLLHPKAASPAHNALFGWALGKQNPDSHYLTSTVCDYFARAQAAKSAEELVGLMHDCPALSREMLPSAFLNHPLIQQVLVLKGMPYTALVRSLGPFTASGALDDPKTLDTVLRNLSNPEGLKKARVHPINLLVAAKAYQRGKTLAGAQRANALSWSPKVQILDALEKVFLDSLSLRPGSSKRILIALDISGSMAEPLLQTGLTYRQAALALALPILRACPEAGIVGFAREAAPININEHDTLATANGKLTRLSIGCSTAPSSAIVWATKNRIAMDALVMISDNEINAGANVVANLDAYRRTTGLPTKLVVLNLGLKNFSVADPNRLDNLDIAGFDAAVPTILENFIGLDTAADEEDGE